MPRKYNYIYKQLVEDRGDIIGHIAYALYKLTIRNKLRVSLNNSPFYFILNSGLRAPKRLFGKRF